MIRRPPRSTLFPTRRSSDLQLSWLLLRMMWRTDSLLQRLKKSLPEGENAWVSPYLMAVYQTKGARSEEHTSELQSRQYLVCRLLLEKKNEDRKSTRLNSSHA